MIDEKKIKEVARAYCDAIYGTLKEEPFIAESFRQGAIWAQKEFIKSLWHDASEEPKYRKFILLEVACKVIDRYAVYFTDGSNSWADICSRVGVIRWLYIDDLLPKEGGKQ